MVRNPLPTSSEDGIPEIIAEQRLGHQVPGIRGLYAHASQRMRDELTGPTADRGGGGQPAGHVRAGPQVAGDRRSRGLQLIGPYEQ